MKYLIIALLLTTPVKAASFSNYDEAKQHGVYEVCSRPMIRTYLDGYTVYVPNPDRRVYVMPACGADDVIEVVR